MTNTPYEDFRAYLREKENTGIIRILYEHPRFMICRGDLRESTSFEVLVGYYRQLIEPEIRRIRPLETRIQHDSIRKAHVFDIPADELIQVRVYF